jgi:hypothetical protein
MHFLQFSLLLWSDLSSTNFLVSHVEPSLLGEKFRTARSGQGRAVLARRSRRPPRQTVDSLDHHLDRKPRKTRYRWPHNRHPLPLLLLPSSQHGHLNSKIVAHWDRSLYSSCSLGWRIRAKPKLQVSRITSGVEILLRTMRDAARIGSVTAPKSVAAARSTARALFACNSERIFTCHSLRKSSILAAKVSIVSCI